MARLLTYGALVVSALVLQLTVLDTLPFPGDVTPDVVLLVVVAVALTSGPVPGLATGFGGGLALDLVPPAVHAAGEYALVFCLIGYAFGQAAGEVQRSAFLPIAAMALGASAGSFLYTVVGVTFGEPDVTWSAARHVLPLAVTYDVLLSPFVLYVVMWLLRRAGQAVEDPSAALARTRVGAAGGASRATRHRGDAPRELKIRPGNRPSQRIGAGAASRMLAASGRSSSDSATATGGRGWRPSPPRLRFGRAKARGTAQGARPGVFSGGSLVGGATVRLHLRSSRGSRLASRNGQALRMQPNDRQPAPIRFGSTRSAMTASTPARSGKRPRFGGRRLRGTPLGGPSFGKRRFGGLRLGRPRFRRSRAARLRRGGTWLTAWRPGSWRSVIGRPGSRRTGGLR